MNSMKDCTRKVITCVFGFYVFFAISCKSDSVNSDMKHTSTEQMENNNVEYAMVIHGGAGTILKENMTEELEAAYRDALNKALDIGNEILKSGGSSEEAVINTIAFMEDSPLFNAGKGSVFTHAGTNEMDASIMRGSDLEAGAVGGIKTIKNPIKAAYAVMTQSNHVFLSGEGAEEFAEKQKLESIDPSYFHTEKRWNSLQSILEKEQEIGMNITDMADSKFGTVGAVALDKTGNIVAGTSTGGMTNKRYGRIGDSPVIGAGTYANNASCGVSCTGHGEYFIRYAVAHDVSARMIYGGKSLSDAAEEIINLKLKEVGGAGGLIALDKEGNVTMPFNTEGMYRGYVNNFKKYIGIYKED